MPVFICIIDTSEIELSYDLMFSISYQHAKIYDKWNGVLETPLSEVWRYQNRQRDNLISQHLLTCFGFGVKKV